VPLYNSLRRTNDAKLMEPTKKRKEKKSKKVAKIFKIETKAKIDTLETKQYRIK
jgi:hypothetical protein